VRLPRIVEGGTGRATGHAEVEERRGGVLMPTSGLPPSRPENATLICRVTTISSSCVEFLGRGSRFS